MLKIFLYLPKLCILYFSKITSDKKNKKINEMKGYFYEIIMK